MRSSSLKPAGRSGATLAEVLTASSLFAVFLALCLGLYVRMLRICEREHRAVEALNSNRLASLEVARALRNCEQLLDPPMKVFLNGQPVNYVLLRQQYGDGQTRVVGYRFQNDRLVRYHYSPDYDPSNPETSKPTKILARSECTRFELRSAGISLPSKIQIEIDYEGRDHAVTTLRNVNNFREFQ